MTVPPVVDYLDTYCRWVRELDLERFELALDRGRRALAAGGCETTI